MHASFLLSYLKKRRGTLLMLCAFVLLFSIVFYLYRLPLEAVLYASGLCGAVGIVLLIIDYIRFRNRARLLRGMLDRIEVSIADLPLPGDAVEAGYQALVSSLFQKNSALRLEAETSREELVDYYTLWAHQIKTPIAAMKLLLQTEEAADHEELLNELFKVEQYVEMVLQYLRMESLSADLLLKRYPLDSIVRQAVRKYAPLFIRKHLRLELDGLEAQVLTDEKWLLFVVEQLLSNAVKYTPAGGTVRVYTDADKPCTLVIEDTGIGIAPEDLPRVFERGFTGYNGRADKRSTGIGLYLCKTILTKLSHTIRIDSRPGGGTKVQVGLDHVALEVE